jgi:hypothetical protein
MNSRMNRNTLPAALVSLALLTAGAGSAFAAAPETVAAKGAAFIIGTDAPLPSVTSFSVQIVSIDALTSTGASVALLSSPTTIDFARYNGLQTLIDMNSVPAGTYDKIVITLGPAVIGYLVTESGAAPTIHTEPATLTKTTLTDTLAIPLVVSESEPAGVRMDFDLHKSIEVSSTGQVTGTVKPVFDIGVVRPTDPGAYIDQFDVGVIAPDPGTQSFTIEGPHGRHFTVDVTPQTEWDPGASLSSLTSSSIVQVSGVLDRATDTITADEVVILSQSGFYAGGHATYVKRSTGAASSFDLYVRGVLPATTGVALGQIATVDLGGKEKYFVGWAHNALAEFVFNASALLPGQSIAVGGPATGAAHADAVTVNRVVLREWGYNGKLIPTSIDLAHDTFQLQIDGFAGVLVPAPVSVQVTPRTEFRGGLVGLHELEVTDSLRVVGLLLKNPATGKTVLLARYIDLLD